MSNPVLPPNPSLLAIMIVVRTSEGVKRVYQYPAEPGKGQLAQRPRRKRSSSGSDASTDEDMSDPLDDYFSVDDDCGPSRQDTYGEPDMYPGEPEDSRTKRPLKHWKSYLGLPPDFDQLLCPPPLYHKKRFELGFEELAFLGWPVFARDDGEWKRKKRRKRRSSGMLRRMSTISEQGPEAVEGQAAADADKELDDTTGNESAEPPAESATEAAAAGLEISESQVLKTLIEEPRASVSAGPTLNMFNVVFVMNPPVLEYQLRVDDMYRHVVKKFSRALKWEQERSNFVLRECEKLRTMKAKRAILRASPLARAIATVFAAISASRIAHIDLTPSLSFSLQIPIPTSLASLPDLISPQLPGLWLTTAHLPTPTDAADAGASATPPARPAPHLALLLLTDAATLLADLASPLPTTAGAAPAPAPLAGPLSRLLQHTAPTRPLQQVAAAAGLPLADALFLAAHLVHWRHARALPPLHARNVYVPSPNADARRLHPAAAAAYARRFPPPLPALPQLLALLGAGPGPRPWSALIPSKDHRPVYFELLAWLLRGSWVCQLRAFGWVRVPGDIVAEVARVDAAGADGGDGPGGATPGRATEADTAGAGTLAPAAVRGSGRPASSLSQGLLHGAAPPPPPPTTTLPARLILRPAQATGAEVRQLAAVAAVVEQAEGGAGRARWERCARYLDGAHALDAVAAREGWKRKALEGWRAGWVRLGVLVEARFW